MTTQAEALDQFDHFLRERISEKVKIEYVSLEGKAGLNVKLTWGDGVLNSYEFPYIIEDAFNNCALDAHFRQGGRLASSHLFMQSFFPKETDGEV